MSDGHAMVAGLSDGFWRTDFYARGAKNATTEIERQRFSGGSRNGFRGTNFDANVTAVGAFAGVNFERAAMTVGERWRWTFRIGHGFATALQAMGDGIKDKHNLWGTYKSKPA
jgi:hypothetical protein